MQNIFANISKYSSGDIIITDEHFNIICCNSNCIFTNKKFNLLDIEPLMSNQQILINFENFKNSNKNHLFLKLIINDRRNLQNIPLDMHICKIHSRKRKTIGYSVILQDISQQIRNEMQKETFIDVINHDIKNPIRANIRILELILKNKFGHFTDDLRPILDELLNSCRFMNYMTDNLLIKYKNEYNMYEPAKQKYSMVKLIKEKCSDLTAILNRRHQTVELTVKGCINDVNIDVEEMGKIINNLIINASEQSIDKTKIEIMIESEGNKVKVSFIDFGYPQKEEALNEIFEEYLTCSNKYRKVGFGLELYNCRKIIEAHGGMIYAKNNNNKGTRICFLLPVCA